MKVYTDSPNFADLIVQGAPWSSFDSASKTEVIGRLAAAVFVEKPVFESEVRGERRWRYLFISESSERSQYDLLIDQRRQGLSIPDGVLCLSGAGRGLHGLRQRPWAAEAGNIHLSVHLAPDQTITASGIPFMVLAAVSVVDAIDSVPGLTAPAGIKWVNDILINNSKVAGVLAYTEGGGRAVDAAVLGIGLNVETTPNVAGTPFVSSVASLRDFTVNPAAASQAFVLNNLLAALDSNYRLLLDGGAEDLIARYRKHSIVVGREVTVYVDDPNKPLETIAKGTVERVGDNLELYLAGLEAAVTRGRLTLEPKT